MKDKIKKRLGLFVVFFLGIGFGVVFQGYKEFQIKVEDIEAKAALSGFITAQQTFWDEYDTYGDDPIKIGFGSLHNDKYEFYLKPEDVPQKYKGLLSVIGMPYAQKDSYRIVLLFKNRYRKKISFWFITEKKIPYEIITNMEFE